MRGGKGPPILFLHGAGGAGIWLPFMTALSEHYDVIVPDHPGFGRSDTPQWLDQLSDLAYFYLDLIEALNGDLDQAPIGDLNQAPIGAGAVPRTHRNRRRGSR